MGIKGVEINGKMANILKDMLTKDCKKTKVADHKMTKEQKALWDQCEKAFDIAKVAGEKADLMKRKFWNMIEGELELFGKDLKINTDDSTIEVYDDDCENCEEK